MRTWVPTSPKSWHIPPLLVSTSGFRARFQERNWKKSAKLSPKRKDSQKVPGCPLRREDCREKQIPLIPRKHLQGHKTLSRLGLNIWWLLITSKTGLRARQLANTFPSNPLLLFISLYSPQPPVPHITPTTAELLYERWLLYKKKKEKEKIKKSFLLYFSKSWGWNPGPHMFDSLPLIYPLPQNCFLIVF